jgi:TDG/mug DNA glycosylase family protein
VADLLRAEEAERRRREEARRARQESRELILADSIRPGLRLVFCGTALGTVAARKRAYYAGPGNAFYKTLYEVGLTPRRLEPAQYPELLDYGIGVTDICKTRFGSDQEVGTDAHDVERLITLLEENEPAWIAFNGKNSASAAFGCSVEYGAQEERLAGVRAYVLPSTSGAARRYWDISHWRSLAGECSAWPSTSGCSTPPSGS